VSSLPDHAVIAPIVLPMLVGGAMVLIGERWRGGVVALGLLSMLGLVLLAGLLLVQADAPAIRVYRLGDWPSLFGIVLVADRLSAVMLLLAALLGLAAHVASLARWHRAGVHFHPLLQFQVMGLNGTFLTGDLFNLFVFFEVMLAASYGLALHGSGAARVRAGLHYIVINLLGSALFLIGVSVVYGVAGTLNLADLATRVRDIPAENRPLLEAGLALLGVAFLTKAAMWPLGFWLTGTYAAASAPAAAILSMLSKVGIYAILRVWLLLGGADSGESAGFGASWLFLGGLATIAFGSIAVLATQNLSRLAGASVLVSSGTLLAAIGAGRVEVTSGALFYLVSSVLAIGAFFLLIEVLERGREVGADVLAVTREAFGSGEEEEPAEEVGVAFPGTVALLGLAFLGCALLLAGLPPLPGFLAKFAILAAVLGGDQGALAWSSWALLAALILSGLAMLVSLLRAGIEIFWASPAERIPRVRAVEFAPIVLLLVLSAGLAIGAGPAMDYLQSAARALHAPQEYLRGVIGERAGA